MSVPLSTDDELLLEKLEEPLLGVAISYIKRQNRRYNQDNAPNRRRKIRYVETMSQVYDRIMSAYDRIHKTEKHGFYVLLAAPKSRPLPDSTAEWLLKNGAFGDAILCASARLQSKGHDVKLDMVGTPSNRGTILLNCKFGVSKI